ncbi:ABC transporter substrate-binding protein [Streptomyces globisporus]|uniref:ABC transporter substrate-binding protein n=1 Tax=Streptomyces globisporus TaxID=1908 RepID=UPI0036FBE668
MPMTKGSMSTSMEFIRPGILAGPFALLFASGCQSSPTDSADEKPITIGTSSVLAGLDPAGVYDAGSWAVFTNIYQNLLTFEPGSPTPKPDAAESCEFTSPALTTYRCELRDGLTFSNGNPLTATAVKHSFERILRIRDPLGPGPLFANLLSVDARGSLVTFRLATADATWPSKIATGAGPPASPLRYASSSATRTVSPPSRRAC